MDYTSRTDAATVVKRWKDRVQKRDITKFLLPFGYGDGGGGPPREMLETSIRMEKGIRACLKCRWKARRNFLKIAHKTERRRIVMSANCISNVIGEHIRPKRRLNAATERASWPCARRKSGALRRRTNFHIQQKNLTAVGKMCCLTSFMIFCQEAALHACMRKPTSCIAKS